MNENKHIVVEKEAHKKLTELAGKYKTSAKDFAQKMIEYFYRTGHDPENLKVEGSTEAIKKLDKRLISFIRAQEKEKLNPMLKEVSLASKQLQDFAGEFATKEHVRQLVNNQKKLKEILEEIQKKLGS